MKRTVVILSCTVAVLMLLTVDCRKAWSEIAFGPINNGSLSLPGSADYHRTALMGDFDGDLKTDILIYRNDDNAWSANVYLSQGNGHYSAAQPWAERQGGYWTSQKWLTGDFNGDGKTDVMKYWKEANNWTADVHISNGHGFTMQRWATQQGGYWTGQKWYAADFNGDGRCDIAKYWNDNGQWTVDVHISTGSSFVMQRWATRQGGYSTGQYWAVGDFNNDQRADFVKYWNDNNQWTADVHLSTGSSFTIQRWATQQGGFWNSQQWFTGDFNDDGMTDLAKYWNDGNAWTVDVHLSTGSAFTIQRWATQQGGFWTGQQWFVGDFNGDFKTDFASVWNDAGHYTADVHLSTGNSFNIQRWLTQGGTWFETFQYWLTLNHNADASSEFVVMNGDQFNTWVVPSTADRFNLYNYDPRLPDFYVDDFTISLTGGPELTKQYVNGSYFWELCTGTWYDLKGHICNGGDKISPSVYMQWYQDDSPYYSGFYWTGGMVPDGCYWTAVPYKHAQGGNHKIRVGINSPTHYTPEMSYDNNYWTEYNVYPWPRLGCSN